MTFTPRISKFEYRSDIDGLRALSVLGVVGFHAGQKLVPGGYVGVDVFFVISGFLISGIIFTELDKGRFSFIGFYARRIRRIFPALLLILAATLVAGALLLLPTAFARVGREAIAGAAFFSNILYWWDTGYFDTAAAQKPPRVYKCSPEIG